MRFLFVIVSVLLSLPANAQETARIGIFGVVEGVSPLVIAGLEITVPPDLGVISPLGTGFSLSVGDTVAVAAVVDQRRLIASRLLEVYPVIGPVASIDGTTAMIMGSAVHVPPGTRLKTGDWVAVSGFWSGKTVITTKLRVLAQAAFGHLTGVIEGPDQMLGGSIIRSADPPADGFGSTIWMLSGTSEVAGLQVQLVARGVFGGPVDLALWQGHASAPIASQTYMIFGTGILGTAQDAQMPDAGTFVTRCAASGRALYVAPEGLEEAFAVLDCARDIQAD